MLHGILQLTGIDRKLQSLKDQIESQAQGMIEHGRAVAIQMAIVAALAAGAGILALMAFVAGLITLYLWLEPQIGSIAAMGLVAGALLVVGVALAIVAVVIGRKEAPEVAPETKAVEHASAFAEDSSRQEAPAFVTPLSQPVTAAEVDSLFAVAGTFSNLPQTGIEPLDSVIRGLAPKAEEASKEAVARAADLVRHGDRTTVMAILATAMVLGWAMTRADQLARS